MPKSVSICVIIPVYNVEPYILRCIDSVLNQTFTDFKLVLVDDGSPDNCGKICDEYANNDSRIFVIHKQNSGQADARNVGLDWAYNNLDFEWIAFIDSDDWVHHRYLELLYKAVTSTGMLVSSCGYIITKTIINDEIIKGYPQIIIDSPEELTIQDCHDKFNPDIPWGRLYNKKLFCNVRYPSGRYYEDGFIIHKVLFHLPKIAVVDEKLYYWYFNTESTNRSKPTPKKTNDYIDAMLTEINYYKNNGFHRAYTYEVSLFLYRLTEHLKKHKNDKNLKKVNKRFIAEARKLIQSDKEVFTFSKYDDAYRIVFSKYKFFLYRLLNKLDL